jgi:hypothetical protein
MPELLHPRMSDIKREQFGSLCLALESEESRTGALGAIRALIEAKVLEPDFNRLVGFGVSSSVLGVGGEHAERQQ